MFLLHEVYVVLLVVFALILTENGFLTKGRASVIANGNAIIPRPFLYIEKPQQTKILITRPQTQYKLDCKAEIEEAFFYQNETTFFFTWYRNDTALETYSGRRNEFYVYHNGTLRLPASEKSSGVYRCQINANNTALLSESITVEYPVLKRMTNVFANVTLIAGQSYTFNCPFFSVPQANTTWLVANTTWLGGNITLSQLSAPLDNRYLLLTNGSLVIRKATVNDLGKYKCFAHNQYTNKTHRQFTWSVNVTNHGIVKQSAQLIPYLQSPIQYVPIGAPCTLMCKAQDDASTIEWWFQRTLNSAAIKLANNSHEYHIDYASFEDHEGYYTCSLLATKEKQTFAVIVTMPPTILEPLPSFESPVSASMTFRCRTYGNPRPQLSWYHNGQRLNSSFSRYINGNELLIHSFDPDEAGIYQCFARNVAGEVYSAAEMRFKNRFDEKPRANPLKNIRCYAHSFNTINITFDSQPNESLFIVHIVQSHPHRWSSPFAPMRLNHTTYIVISNQLPIYRPFQLITRVLFPTSEIRSGKKTAQTTILSSLRSPPVTCCTQGLLLHLMHLDNDTFVTWSQPDLEGKKYFALQFATSHTHPHPKQLEKQILFGTQQNVDLKYKDVKRKLVRIEPLSQTLAQSILQKAENKYLDNEARSPSNSQDVEEEPSDIFSMVLHANVTGILLQHFTRIKMRVLIITKENEHLAQDFRYVQWKIIENNTSELANSPFRLTTVESRMLTFHFRDGFNETCINACHCQIQFPIISIKEEQKCERKMIVNSMLEIRNLKPTERYRLNFFSCESQIFYGQLDVQTLPDPPGTISNHSVIRHEGLKLIWSPPKQQNGKIHHYNILWTLGNVTHEANVLDCTQCYYKFPNISESAKINVTVRVVGETGVGAPIYVDLRHINHHTLDVELSTSDSEVYRGIAIGSLLSTCCVLCFALLIIFQRRRFKARQETPTHLTTPSELNFSSLNNPSLPSGSAGGLSGGSTVQQDYYEMQTLIPKARRQIDFQTASTPTNEFYVTHLLNGTNVLSKPTPEAAAVADNTNTTSNATRKKLARLSLGKEGDRKPFFISLKQLPAPLATSTTTATKTTTAATTTAVAAATTALNKIKPSAPNAAVPVHQNNSSCTMPMRTALSAVSNGAHRNDEKLGLRKNNSSCSIGSSSSSSKRAFSTNFPKHSNSYDGICLLVEEESVSTPTAENSEVVMKNGYKTLKEPLNMAAAVPIHLQPTTGYNACKFSSNLKTRNPTTNSNDNTSAINGIQYTMSGVDGIKRQHAVIDSNG